MRSPGDLAFSYKLDAHNLALASQSTPIPFIKKINLRANLYHHPDFHLTCPSLGRPSSDMPYPSLAVPGAVAALASNKDLKSLPPLQTPPTPARQSAPPTATSAKSPVQGAVATSQPPLRACASPPPDSPQLPASSKEFLRPKIPSQASIPEDTDENCSQPVGAVKNEELPYTSFLFSRLPDGNQLPDEKLSSLLQAAKTNTSDQFAIVYRGSASTADECALIYSNVPKRELSQSLFFLL